MPKERDPLTLDEAQQILSRAARNVGRAYAVTMSIGRDEERLIFVNDMGEPIVDEFQKGGDEPGPILAADKTEIENGSFFLLFAARALYAALVQKAIDVLLVEGEG